MKKNIIKVLIFALLTTALCINNISAEEFAPPSPDNKPVPVYQMFSTNKKPSSTSSKSINTNRTWNISGKSKATKFKIPVKSKSGKLNIKPPKFGTTTQNQVVSNEANSKKGLIVKFKPNTDFDEVKVFLKRLNIKYSPPVAEIYWTLQLPGYIPANVALKIFKNDPAVETVEISIIVTQQEESVY